MSTCSSNATEMASISSGNSAVVETDASDINAGYTSINDTGLQRKKRRLPMPPATKPPRPKKNFTLCTQPCKDLCSYCVGSRLILSIALVVLTLAALGVLIYLLLTNIRDDHIPAFPPTAKTKDADGVPEGSNGTLRFVMPPVQDPEVLNLLQERIGQNVTILQNVKLKFTNETWSFDGREISINISMGDKGYFNLVLNMEITNSQCRHAGKYFVVLFSKNHKAEQSLVYKVQAECPCESDYELTSGTELKCELKVIGNTTISFKKVSNEKLILYQTGIRIPDNVPESGRFSAIWNRSGTLTTRITFSPVRCLDEGNYSLTVTSRKGTQLHYMYVRVIDHPNDPTISTQGGLIKDKPNVIQCQASTGCTNASLIVENTEANEGDYSPWQENLTSINYQEGYIWKANASLILTSYLVNPAILGNRCFRCKYSIGDKPYYSKPICIQIIPDTFCVNKTLNCNYPHPYDCTKYITCMTSGPVERICSPGLHYPQDVTTCAPACKFPSEANCKIQPFKGCGCKDI